MPSNKTEFAARVALTKPSDGVRGIFFRVVFELIEKRGGPDALRRVRSTEGLSKEMKDLRTYPASDYLALLYNAADVLEPKLGSEDQVFNACGRACLHSFSGGMGQIVFGILGKGHPQRLFAQTSGAFSTVVTYGKREHTATGPNTCLIRYRGDMQPPAYHVGIFEAALDTLGMQGLVTAQPHQLDSVDYHISWN
ncbi:TIGR02265 family protein [Melittangium boletus]|uniref:TIGR02265 family protein n=1 Tax=Melittangium boletus DSM 14713 TaxID=1294270 RepID=A0A250IBG0_9BACT|nr:TIGR02265 family protein [Melittangium boletus]ATB28550.1 hypothetical protein MEBOL_001999 [Melittangium boletus DSM 14713]